MTEKEIDSGILYLVNPWCSNKSMLKIQLLFLAALLSFSVSTWSANPENIKPDNRKHTSQEKQTGTENSPFYIRGEITANKNEQEAAEDAKERAEKASIDRTLVKYTGLLALFTFLLFGFTAGLWWVTLQLGRDAKRSSERQSAEIEKSLKIASQSAAAAERTAQLIESKAERQLRAYIGISQTFVAIDPTMIMKCLIVFRNSGQTPANNLSVWYETSLFDIHGQGVIPEEAAPEKRGNTSSLGAFSEMQIEITNGMNKLFDIGETFKGVKVFHVFGRIDYTDVFNMPRYTRFRLIAYLGRDMKWALHPYKEGNDAT